MSPHSSPAAASDEQHDLAAAPQQRRQSNAAPAPMQEPGQSVSQVLIYTCTYKPAPTPLCPSQMPLRSTVMQLVIAADEACLHVGTQIRGTTGDTTAGASVLARRPLQTLRMADPDR